MTVRVVEVVDSHEALVELAVGVISAAAVRGPVALSGGATPLPAYRAVAESGVIGSWYQVDERHVPYGTEESNATQIERQGLSLHRIRSEHDPEAAASSYEREVRTAWAGTAFALAVLGLGEDGHTASLFPGAPEIGEQTRWVVATAAPHAGTIRVTMTLPLLHAIGQCVFLVTGERKRDAVRRILVDNEDLPAGRVKRALWILDAAAGADVR